MRFWTALSALWVCAAAQAAVYRFDMGGPDTPLAPGYTLVTKETTLEQSPAYGWRKPGKRLVFRGVPTNPFFHDRSSLEYMLYSDGVLTIEENIFEFKVEPGSYRVSAVIGDLSPGEDRPGNSLWANGVQVASNELTDGTVKIFSFAVDAPDGRIALRFRADSVQKYSTVMSVTADPLAPGADRTPAKMELPSRKPGKEDYLRNWKVWQADYVAVWEKAKAELKAEGFDVDALGKRFEGFKAQAGWRPFYVSGAGGGDAWARLDPLAGNGVTMEGVCRVLKEMGVDVFIGGDAVVAREFPKNGLAFGVHGSGEGFWGMEKFSPEPNVLCDREGKKTDKDGPWSNAGPRAIAAYREHNQKRLGDCWEGAMIYMVDEPRGQWFAGGRYGDYSECNKAAFNAWAAAQGLKDLATGPIPERGRTMDFYHFYRYRLETPFMFVAAVVKDTPLARTLVAPGNGRVGPELLNHHCYWPPSAAQRGMVATGWLYLSPAQAKMEAEVLRLANEAGGRSIATTELWVYHNETPVSVVPLNTAGISALCDGVNAFGFAPAIRGPNAKDWMKAVFIVSRLVHATSGLTRAPAVRVWLPQSISFNDLADLNTAEADRWAALRNALFEANVDFTVTNLLNLPPKEVVIYCCARPTLSEQEFERLKAFVDRGGTLVAMFDGDPETPDGRPIAGWKTLPAVRVIRAGLSVDELRAKAMARAPRRNMDTGVACVKSFLYSRQGKPVHLLSNTDVENAREVKLAPAMVDAITGEKFAAGATVRLGPGRYALLEETQ